MRTFVLCVFSLVSACAANAQDVTDELDRFTGVREITYKSSSKIQLGVPYVFASAKIKDEVTVFNVTFLVGSFRGRNDVSGWKYLRCHRVNWLVDGVPLEVGETKHDGQVTRGGVNEIIQQPLTLEQMKKLGSASSVEYRICNDEFRLSADEIAGIASVASRASGQFTPARQAEPSQEMQYRPKLP